jgi:hypothetical protein
MKTVRKIIIIGPAFPYRGGIAAFTDRLAKEFFAESFDIEVFTFSLQYPSALFPGKTQYSDAKAPDNIVIHRTINSVNPFSWFKTVKMITKKIRIWSSLLIGWRFSLLAMERWREK